MIEVLPLEKVRPSTDNLRKPIDVDDELRALRRSIDSVGLLQPLVVRKARNGSYDIVAGHRRFAACAIDPPIAEVECIVRTLDESHRLGAMFVENFHRKDLTALEEAYGFQRLAEEQKLSQRGIAELCGCDQSHVSRRMKLLALPARVQKELDAGELFIRDAEELCKLAGDTKRIDAAIKNGRRAGWTMARAIEDELRDAKNADARKVSRAHLDRDKVKVIKHPQYSWYSEKAKPIGTGAHYDVEGVTVAEHKTEKCHAAAIAEDGKIIYVCTDPTRHKPKSSTTRRVKSKQEQLADALAKSLKIAAGGRKEHVRALLSSKRKLPARASLAETFARDLVVNVRQPDQVCALLGLDPPVTKKHDNQRYYACKEALATYVAVGDDNLMRAALAVLAFERESTLTSPYHTWCEDQRAQNYFALLTVLGYTPSDVERAQLDGRQLSLDELAPA